jgi:hypothetical protein
MLTGEAKKVYQREYMRKRRSVRPNVRPLLDPSPLTETVEKIKVSIGKIKLASENINELLAQAKPTICPACGGKGYREFEAGLIRLPCRECQK